MELRTIVTEAILANFRDIFGDRFKLNEPIGRYTSARVGGRAELYVAVNSADELQMAAELAYAQQVPYFILGGGSNILVADEGLPGLVIHNRAKNISFRHSGAGVVCTADAGVNLSSLARQCMAKGLGGLEWAVSIPGTVGGAVVGNAGAHGGDMSDCVRAVKVWTPGKGQEIINNEQMGFEYRNSVLKEEHFDDVPRRVVLDVELILKPEAPEILLGRADAFIAHRKQTQPGGASTGSMFKNPDHYYAGYLIETAGLKGMRIGGAVISEKHANFFVNEDNCRAEDIRELIAEAWHVVRTKFGIEMDLEVELVGDWNFEFEEE